jgi:phosphoserine phosphatase RsbU/P
MKHALFETLPGRAIIVGLVVKLIVVLVRITLGDVPAFLGVVDSVASIAAAIGAGYFLLRLLVLAKRRLLWRVRRKLILSYIFIGFVPAILIVAFFILCGLLLFFNVSSYLVQTELRTLQDRTRFLATSAALEIQRAGGRNVAAILASKQANVEPEYRNVSLALVPVDRACAQTGQQSATADAGAAGGAKPITAGPWAHVDPPRTLPGWIGCDGFSGLLAYSHEHDSGEDTHIFARAAAFPDSPIPGYAVVADLPVGDEIGQRLRRETGVQLKKVTALNIGSGGEAKPIAGRPAVHTVTPTQSSSGPLSWVTFLEYRDWTTGQAGTLLVSTELSISEIYNRIAAAQGSRTRLDRQSQLRPGAAARPPRRRRRPLPDHRGRGALRRLRAGQVDHRIGS